MIKIVIWVLVFALYLFFTGYVRRRLLDGAYPAWFWVVLGFMAVVGLWSLADDFKRDRKRERETEETE